MNRATKGFSPLVSLADGLPIRARIGLAVIAAGLATHQLRSSPDFPIAYAAFDLTRRSFDGERFDPYLLEDSLASESGDGAVHCEVEAKSKEENAAWLALISSVLYIAHHACRELSEFPSEMICEVDETELDEIDKFLRPISPASMKAMQKSAECLKQELGASFAQLRPQVAELGREL